MKFSTTSIEEVFALFIACAFTKDALKHIIHQFEDYYNPKMITSEDLTKLLNESSENITKILGENYNRDSAILWLGLALATLWLGLLLFKEIFCL